MEERVIRVRIHPVLYKRYKILCAELDLSMAKQVTQMMRTFIEIQEENKRILEHAKKKE